MKNSLEYSAVSVNGYFLVCIVILFCVYCFVLEGLALAPASNNESDGRNPGTFNDMR